MRAWITITWLLVAIVGAWNIAQTSRRVLPPPRAAEALPANVVLRHERRMASVREALAAHGVRGTVGYFADLPPVQLRGDAAGMEAYFVSQFALAPWILDATSDQCEWAVANLQRVAVRERVPAAYRMVHDGGDGVLLLRRSAP